MSGKWVWSNKAVSVWLEGRVVKNVSLSMAGMGGGQKCLAGTWYMVKLLQRSGEEEDVDKCLQYPVERCGTV